MTNYNARPSAIPLAPELAGFDPATAETLRRAQLVKFAPEEFYEQGHPGAIVTLDGA